MGKAYRGDFRSNGMQSIASSPLPHAANTGTSLPASQRTHRLWNSRYIGAMWLV